MFEILLGSLIGLFGFTQTVDTKPQPQGTVNLSQPLTPNGPYRESVQLEPMSQLQFRNVIRQAYDYSCGSAALTTLLDYYLGRNLEERQVMEGLLRYGEADKIVQRRGFSLLDMKRTPLRWATRAVVFAPSSATWTLSSIRRWSPSTMPASSISWWCAMSTTITSSSPIRPWATSASPGRASRKSGTRTSCS